jgi:hypothetical protein
VDNETKKTEVSRYRKTIAGLVWAEGGNPFFYCLVSEKALGDKANTFDDPEPIIEIIHEGEAGTFTELEDILETFPKFHCRVVYTAMEPKYLTFIRMFNTWKRKTRSDVALKQTKSSSFEASLITIKGLIGDKRLEFPSESIIRSQLTVFSKESLKHEVNSYAVRALTMVVDAFQKKTADKQAETPNLKAWW